MIESPLPPKESLLMKLYQCDRSIRYAFSLSGVGGDANTNPPSTVNRDWVLSYNVSGFWDQSLPGLAWGASLFFDLHKSAHVLRFADATAVRAVYHASPEWNCDGPVEFKLVSFDRGTDWPQTIIVTKE